MVAQDPPGGLRAGARRVLEDAWRPEEGYCVPNARIYPHQWLWDSCFHSIAWAALGDPRAVVELRSTFARQFRNGFVPHMSYRGRPWAGGRAATCPASPSRPCTPWPWTRSARRAWAWTVTCSTRRDAAWAISCGSGCGRALLRRPPVGDRLRRLPALGRLGGRLRLGPGDLARRRPAAGRGGQVSPEGDATSSAEFACAPSLFNGILPRPAGRRPAAGGRAAAGRQLGAGGGDGRALWDEAQGLFVDRPLVGGGDSARVPTIDGALSALGSVRRDHALACLEQLRDPDRFAAPHGLRYLPAGHPTYRPDQYWRGSAWPQPTSPSRPAAAGASTTSPPPSAPRPAGPSRRRLVRALEPRDRPRPRRRPPPGPPRGRPGPSGVHRGLVVADALVEPDQHLLRASPATTAVS